MHGKSCPINDKFDVQFQLSTCCFLCEQSSSATASSSSSAIFASTSADRFAAMTDVEAGKPVWSCKLKAAGNALLPLSGRERFVVGDDDGGLRVFDGRGKKAAVSWSENGDFISDLAVGVDGTSLCATSGDGTLAVYDLRKGGEKGLIAMSDFQDDELLSVAIVRDGKKVVCGSQTGILPIFSWGDFGDQKDRIKGHPMSVDAMVKLSEDGVLTGSSDGKIRAVATHSKSLGSCILGVVGEHGEYPIERLALSPDGCYFASASHAQPAVQLWSTQAAKRLLAGESIDAASGTQETAEAEADEPDSDDSDDDLAPKKKHRKMKEKRKGKQKGTGGGNQGQQKAQSFFSGL